MKTSKALLLAVVFLMGFQVAQPQPLAAEVSKSDDAAARWSVQVDEIDAAGIGLEPSFQLAIYENLMEELSKTKQFKQVVRQGDRTAENIPDLLVLKTTVQKYTPGSETRRAVTTVSGATKLTVKCQLSTRDGQVLVERVVDGNVRFIGSNLRATHNLAHNVAKTIKQQSLPVASTTPADGGPRVFLVGSLD